MHSRQYAYQQPRHAAGMDAAKQYLPPSAPRILVSAVLMAIGTIAATPAMAASGCHSFSQNVVSTTISSTCYLNSGSSLDVTAPSGLISVTGGTAVSVSVLSQVGLPTIENAGRIESFGTPGVGPGTGGVATAVSITGSAPGSVVLDYLTNAAGATVSATGGAGSSDLVMSSGGGAGTAVSLSNGRMNTLTNLGTISGVGGAGGGGGPIGMSGSGGNGTGIGVQAGTVGAIRNEGSIAGTGGAAGPLGTVSSGGAGYGIRLIGSTVSDGIVNQGTVSALSFGGLATGIHVENSSVDAIRNDGVILATSAAVVGLPGLPSISGPSTGIQLVNSTVGEISVAGTITAATAILVDGTSAVTNGIHVSGTLNGTVVLGNATLNLNGNAASINGPVIGSAGSQVTVNGTFASSPGNAFQVGGFNIADNAVFNMAAPVTVSTALNNAGTLAVAPGTTATIHGNYVQAATGAFQTGIANDGSYGKLVVSGTADLSASNKIRVNVAGAPTLVAGTTVQPGIITAGALQAGPAFSVTDNSALFDFIASRNGNAVDLCVARAGAASCDAAVSEPTPTPTPTPTPIPTPTPVPTPTPGQAITVVSSVTGARNMPGLGAAQVFDALIAQGAGAPAAMAPVVTALGTLATEQAVSDAVKQTLPLMTGSMASVNTAAMHATNKVIQSRQEANRGLSSGDDFVTDRQLWFKPVGSWARQSDRDGVAGYNANTYGMLVGADGVVSDKVRLGGAFSYLHSRIDGNSAVAAQRASVDGYRLIGYGSYSLDARTDVSLQADVGTSHNEGQRNIAFGGINRRASSSYNSWNAHVGAGVGRIFALAPKTSLTPSLRADYTFIQDAAYTETGADALSLAVGKNSARELILSTDLRLNQAVAERGMFTANLGVGYDALAGQSSITAAYVGGGAQFVTRGMPPERWLMRGGLGFAVTNSKAMEFSVRYDAEIREHFTNQTASVKLRMPF